MQGASNIPEPDYPYPVRYWWLKRICVLAMSLLVLLTITRFVWGWDAQRRLRREIARIQAAGEPVLLDEFKSANNIGKNQAIILDQALLLSPKFDSQPADGLLAVIESPSQLKNLAPSVEQSLRKDVPTLKLLRHARELPPASWNYSPPPRGPAQSYSVLHYLLQASTLLNHAQANDFETIESTRDNLALVEAVATRPGLIEYLTGVSLSDDLIQTLILLAPHLQVDGRPRSAQREQIRALMGELLVPFDAKLVERAFLIERAEQIAHAERISNASTLLGPMYLLDAVDIVRDMNQGVLAAKTTSWHDARFHLEKSRIPKLDRDNTYANRLSELTGLGVEQWLWRGYVSRFSKQAAATALAIRLYVHDHDGQFPATLDALVPEYLNAVPIDPFSKEKRPIHYLLAEAGRRPILASVGMNEVADVVPTRVLPAEPLRSGYSGMKDVDDYLFYILGPRIVPVQEP